MGRSDPTASFDLVLDLFLAISNHHCEARPTSIGFCVLVVCVAPSGSQHCTASKTE